MKQRPYIAVVVVTYNRAALLQKNIGCLRAQTLRADEIIVVNNGSTDDTRAWLDAQTDLTLVHQDNVGGSGGFYTGIRLAYDHGADFIWCMDDDVYARPTCLEELMKETSRKEVGIWAPRRLMEGRIFTHDFQAYNLTNPFRSMYQQRLKKQTVTGPTEIKGTAFEGPMIRREVVGAIGLPNRDLFIFCDDTDYCLRTVLAGYQILYVPAALMDKQRFFSEDTWAERSRKKRWKRFYQVRNATYLNHHYGRNWGVRYLRGLLGVSGYLATVLVTCPFSQAYQWSDLGRLWRAYRDGLRERLGKMPPV